MPYDTTYRTEGWSVIIAWHGLATYAARAIRATTATIDVPFKVIGTPGVESPKYIEGLVGRKVTWILPGERVTWRDLGLVPPAVFFHTGWSYKAFNALASETKLNGGHTVCMVDNPRAFTLRQMLGRWYFRAVLQRRIDQVLVPGQAAQDLMRYFGVAENRIHQGLLGADPAVFSPGPPLSERIYDFIFVGRFISLKGIHCLVEAIRILRTSGKPFSVIAVGQGPLQKELLAAGVRVEPFSSAEVVAAWLRKSRFLVLPSNTEHWGLVVHEAALSGCGLILSKAVGSWFEFAGSRNSWGFTPGASRALARAMTQGLALSGHEQAECHAQSIALAANFGPRRWNESVEDILLSCGRPMVA